MKKFVNGIQKKCIFKNFLEGRVKNEYNSFLKTFSVKRQ